MINFPNETQVIKKVVKSGVCGLRSPKMSTGYYIPQKICFIQVCHSQKLQLGLISANQAFKHPVIFVN